MKIKILILAVILGLLNLGSVLAKDTNNTTTSTTPPFNIKTCKKLLTIPPVSAALILKKDFNNSIDKLVGGLTVTQVVGVASCAQYKALVLVIGKSGDCVDLACRGGELQVLNYTLGIENLEENKDKEWNKKLNGRVKVYLQNLKFILDTTLVINSFDTIDTFCPEGSAFCLANGNINEVSSHNAQVGNLKTIREGFLQKIAQIITGSVAAIAIIMIIISAFKIATAAGDESQLKEAVGAIKYEILGLFVIIFAYFIVANVITLAYKFFN